MATGSSGRLRLRGDTADLLILLLAFLAAVTPTLSSLQDGPVPLSAAPLELGIEIPDDGLGDVESQASTIANQALPAAPILIVSGRTTEGAERVPGLAVLDRAKWGERGS